MTPLSRATATPSAWHLAALSLWAVAGLGLAAAVQVGGASGDASPFLAPAVLFGGLVWAVLARNAAPLADKLRQDRSVALWAAGTLGALGSAVVLWLAMGIAKVAGFGANPSDPVAALLGALAIMALWGGWIRWLAIGLVVAPLGYMATPGTAAALGSAALGAGAVLSVLLRLGIPRLPPVPAAPVTAMRDRLGLSDRTHLSMLAMLFGLMLAAWWLFLMVPGLDIGTSALFFDSDTGFFLSKEPRMEDIRGVYEAVIYSAPVIALVMLLGSARLDTRIPAQIWGFTLAAFVIGPGLIANSLFKNTWGRARPADIEAFGGQAEFTLPFVLSDQCARNCSFVSGEGSGIAMAAIVALLLFWPFLATPRWRWVALSVVLALPGLVLRIAKGRHFLSDTVFAVLMMAVVALVLFLWFGIARHREALSWDALLHDLAAMADYLLPARHGAPSIWRDLSRLFRAVLDALLYLAQQGAKLARPERARHDGDPQ